MALGVYVLGFDRLVRVQIVHRSAVYCVTDYISGLLMAIK